jgi:hypothetical protein
MHDCATLLATDGQREARAITYERHRRHALAARSPPERSAWLYNGRVSEIWHDRQQENMAWLAGAFGFSHVL